MAYFFTSPEYIEASTAAVTALPFTLAARFNAFTTHTGAILSINTSGATRRAVLFSLTDNTVQFSYDLANPISKTTGTYSLNTWHHIAGVANAGVWQCYLDGVTAGATNDATAPGSFAGCDRTAIGMRISTTPGGYFSGRIAETAIWNVELTTPELAALASGFSPQLIRPASLVFYAPLIRELVAPKSGFALTNTGAVPYPHPRIINPRKRRRGLILPLPPPPTETLFAQACL